MIHSDGPYLNDAPFQKVWLTFLDMDTVECVYSMELKFRFPPEFVSWLTASDFFQFVMSSPMTQNIKEGKMVCSQNYHFVCHTPEYHFHEILEYKIDYVCENGKIVEIKTELIGKANFITSETFNDRC